MSESTPDPVDTTIRELAQIYEETHRSVGPIQRIANRSTRLLSRPGAVTVMVVLMVAWMAGNQIAKIAGLHAPDAYPYPGLELAATLVALVTTLLILTTQRHEEKSDLRRDRLTLQIATLSEKKIAKVIALLEEQRRDNPLLATRVDQEAEAMAAPTDTMDSLHRLEQLERAGPMGDGRDD